MDGPIVTPEDIRRVQQERLAEAYSSGWRAGCGDTLRELERLGCFTTTQAKRTVARLRDRLSVEEEHGA